VVDVGPSIALWRDSIAEFHRLLSLSGIFSAVERWDLDCDDPNGKIELRPAASCGAQRSARELLDASGRRVVLIVSDCVADAWYDGRAARFIAPWAEAGAASLVQLLPPTHWRRTALADARDLWIHGCGSSHRMHLSADAGHAPRPRTSSLSSRTMIASLNRTTARRYCPSSKT
jgi:hypothetical protein